MSEWKQHYRSGCAAFRSHDYVRAERELTMAIQLNPSCIAVYTSRASVLGRCGRHVEVVRDGKRMIQLDKSNPIGYLFQARAFKQLHDYERALKAVRDGLANANQAEPRYVELTEQKKSLEKLIEKENNLAIRDPANLNEKTHSKSIPALRLTKTRGADFVKKLPNELLSLIFHHLDLVTLVRSCQVSKPWRNYLTHDASLWTSVEFGKHGKRLKNFHLDMLVGRAGNYLQSLDVSGCLQIDEKGLHALARRKCRNLMHLTLSYTNISSFSRLADTLRLLERVRSVEQHHTRTISQGLVSLNLSQCRLKDEDVPKLLVQCPNLKHFTLSSCKDLGGKAFSGLLTLESRAQLPKLQSIDISFCENINDHTVRDLAHLWSSSLAVFDATACFGLSPHSFVYMSQCLQLKTLCMSRLFTNESGLSLDIAALSCSTACFNKLETISLTQCDRLNDDALSHLLSLCNPTTLNFASSSRLTDASVSSIIHSSAHTLLHLNLADCYSISKSAFTDLVRICKQLEMLDVSFNLNVDDTFFREVGQHLKRLKQVSLNQCNNVRGSGVVDMFQDLKSTLKCINMNFCSLLSNDKVQHLRKMAGNSCVINAKLG